MDAISRGNVTDVVYLDFQKAFDTVPHKRLMVKLQAYGISVGHPKLDKCFPKWADSESYCKWHSLKKRSGTWWCSTRECSGTTALCVVHK